MYVMKKKILLISLSFVSLLLSFLKTFSFPFDLAWIAILLCGTPIILEAGEALFKHFDITADVLVAMAIIASVCIGEYFAAGEVALIMALGEELEEFTVQKARSGIEKLVALTPSTARVLNGEGEQVIPAASVQVGDTVRVLPGETVPVDGIILSGKTAVDQSVMTGEPLPLDKQEGDTVASGSLNQFGAFTMKATRRGEDSSIQRMIQLVQSTDAGKAKIVGIADRWAFWIVIIAFVSAVLTAIVTGQVIRGVTILVVFCPCALVLATPTAIVAAIGNVSRHGYLVKEGDALERLASVRKIAFDKTGTLTYGTPKVVSVASISPDLTDEALFLLAASAEYQSEHPLGKAIVRSCRETVSKPLQKAEEFAMTPGKGILAVVEGKKVQAGTGSFLGESGIAIEQMENCQPGHTVIYVAVDGLFAGTIVLSDSIRPESQALISSLKKLNLEPVLLTGDHESTARSVASQLAIDEFHAGLLPEDKLKHIQSFQDADKRVCMIGDGINDAPALKKADVGIVMGKVGSDIAASAADIVLVNDRISSIDHIVALAHRMIKVIHVNMAISMLINFAAVLCAMAGLLNPVWGALVHNAGSFLVVANSALLLRWKKKTEETC